METEETEKNEKNETKYECISCDFKCCFKSDWLRHLTTRKHTVSVNGNQMEISKIKKNETLKCVCGRMYTTNSGLWKHKKNCENVNLNENKKADQIDKELIMMILKQNNDMQSNIKNIVLEVCQGLQLNNNNYSNNTNCNNKTFNLQLFLNETCKDAMNITDFVDSVNLQLSDLEEVGKVGYVEGISNVIIKQLKLLDETKRPVHCTDKKRETIYIKDQGQWEKEDDNKTKLKQTIRKVANKNIKLISQFREKYPECRKSESSISDKYNKMIIEAMGGAGDNDTEKEEKIIRNIAKNVAIEK